MSDKSIPSRIDDLVLRQLAVLEDEHGFGNDPDAQFKRARLLEVLCRCKDVLSSGQTFRDDVRAAIEQFRTNDEKDN